VDADFAFFEVLATSSGLSLSAFRLAPADFLFRGALDSTTGSFLKHCAQLWLSYPQRRQSPPSPRSSTTATGMPSVASDLFVQMTFPLGFLGFVSSFFPSRSDFLSWSGFMFFEGTPKSFSFLRSLSSFCQNNNGAFLPRAFASLFDCSKECPTSNNRSSKSSSSVGFFTFPNLKYNSWSSPFNNARCHVCSVQPTSTFSDLILVT